LQEFGWAKKLTGRIILVGGDASTRPRCPKAANKTSTSKGGVRRMGEVNWETTTCNKQWGVGILKKKG